MRYDLHCHSTRSDGLLSPAEVVRRAASRGVDVLALTDHDETAGLDEARAAADEAGIALVTGAELSVSWEDITIHVVALRFDPAHGGLQDGLEQIRSGRDSRARRIAESLAAAGIPGAYEGARRYVTSERLISRTHFARFLVEAGHVREMKDVFSRYLTPGTARLRGPRLGEPRATRSAGSTRRVVRRCWRIRDATRSRRPGSGVCSASFAISAATRSRSCPRRTRRRRSRSSPRSRASYGLAASTGSDYHGPGESWLDLGDLPPLPFGVDPVWKRW